MKYICDSHDEALAELASIENLRAEMYHTELESVDALKLHYWCNMLGEYVNTAQQLVEEAKESGIRMENGLTKKRNRIAELEELNFVLERENPVHSNINWQLVRKVLDRFTLSVQEDTELVLAYLDQLKALGTRDEAEMLLDLKMAVLESREFERDPEKQEYFSDGTLRFWNTDKLAWEVVCL